jgi:hypothetical protein
MGKDKKGHILDDIQEILQSGWISISTLCNTVAENQFGDPYTAEEYETVMSVIIEQIDNKKLESKIDNKKRTLIRIAKPKLE